MKVFWGRADRWDSPDVCVAWGGGGSNGRDARLILNVINGERMARDWSKPGGPTIWERSLIKELEARGYDITTLKFSIERKKDGNSD